MAQLFPMLSDEELQELASDIAANGLLHPLIVDQNGLLDGRNRLAACRLAGIEPRYTTLNGTDAFAYILAANAKRRNMTMGQIAMTLVKGLSLEKDPVQFGRLGTVELAARLGLKHHNRISERRKVLENAPDLVDAVISGALRLRPRLPRGV